MNRYPLKNSWVYPWINIIDRSIKKISIEQKKAFNIWHLNNSHMKKKEFLIWFNVCFQQDSSCIHVRSYTVLTFPTTSNCQHLYMNVQGWKLNDLRCNIFYQIASVALRVEASQWSIHQMLLYNKLIREAWTNFGIRSNYIYYIALTKNQLQESNITLTLQICKQSHATILQQSRVYLCSLSKRNNPWCIHKIFLPYRKSTGKWTHSQSK